MRFRLGLGYVITALTFGSPAVADIWTEVGDAGDTPATAQVTVGMNSLTNIVGAISNANPALNLLDADMYQIRITGTVPFSVTTVGGAAFDTQVFLFDSMGFGVLANDDTDLVTPQSTIPSTILPAGMYLIAISKYNLDPESALGRIFPDDKTGVVGPTGPGGAMPVISWTAYGGDPKDPPYSGMMFPDLAVDFAVSVPEPCTLVLLGLGTFGFLGYGLIRRLTATSFALPVFLRGASRTPLA